MQARAQGFTYLALLLLLAMMSAVLGMTAEVWHTAVQREKERELLFVGNQFRMAIGAYYLAHAKAGKRSSENAKVYPATLEELLKDTQEPLTRRYLRKIYRDPMTGGSEWGLVRRGDGGIVGVHSLSEDRAIKVAGFDAENVGLEGAEKYADWVFEYSPQKPPAATGTNAALNAGNG